jgi:hypothetical protein
MENEASGHLPHLCNRHIEDQHEERERKKNIHAGDGSSFFGTLDKKRKIHVLLVRDVDDLNTAVNRKIVQGFHREEKRVPTLLS